MRRLAPGAKRGDGDPLDVCVLSERTIARNEIIVRCRVIGGLQMIDHGEADEVAEIWDGALATAWARPPVWVHGDMSPGNLLSRDSRLSGVLDFGLLSVGDPACDLAIAWTVFRGDAREAFRAKLALDPATWLRGRAWALWKGLIVAAGLAETNAVEWANPIQVISDMLDERE